MATPILIDDRDNSISYFPNVTAASGDGIWKFITGTHNEYLGTGTYTYAKGATATLTFQGTSVGVYGTVSNVSDTGGITSPACSYAIDGGNPTIYTAPMTSELQYRVLFFQSPELTSDSQHTLVITVLEFDNSTIFLDFFAVTPPIAKSSLPSSAITIPSSATTIPFGTVTTIPSGTVTSSKPPVGPIIGGVLGALALLTLAFIAFLFFRWKKDRLHKKSNTDAGGAY